MSRARLIGILLLALLLPAIGSSADDPVGVEPSRFAAVEVWIDSGTSPLAAYQLELSADRGDVRIAGIEGGAAEPFREAPYYDPAAMRRDRVVIADFSTAPAEALPTGRARLASIHVQIRGDIEPSFDVTLHAAATVDGAPIDAKVSLQMEQDS